MTSSVTIDFDRKESGELLAGEVVKGHLILDLVRTTLIKRVEFEVVGDSRVFWSEQNVQQSLGTLNVESSVQLFKFEEVLLEEGVLQAGQHEIPFKFDLSGQNVASSFKGQCGAIKYQMTVTVTSTNIQPMSTCEKMKVKCPLVLSGEVSAFEKVKKVCPGLLGDVTLSANLNRQYASCPGCILFDAEFKNMSNFGLAPKVSLYQKETYTGSSFASLVVKKKIVVKKVCRLFGQSIPAKQTVVWNGQKLALDQSVSSSVLNCTNIKVEHFIRIKFGLVTSKLFVDLPVLI